ncbi:hypothetical protein ABIC50_005008 [Burkholderia sp. 567]
MATGATPAKTVLSSSAEGNLTIDFVDRDETVAGDMALASVIVVAVAAQYGYDSAHYRGFDAEWMRHFWLWPLSDERHGFQRPSCRRTVVVLLLIMTCDSVTLNANASRRNEKGVSRIS